MLPIGSIHKFHEFTSHKTRKSGVTTRDTCDNVPTIRISKPARDFDELASYPRSGNNSNGEIRPKRINLKPVASSKPDHEGAGEYGHPGIYFCKKGPRGGHHSPNPV